VGVLLLAFSFVLAGSPGDPPELGPNLGNEQIARPHLLPDLILRSEDANFVARKPAGVPSAPVIEPPELRFASPSQERTFQAILPPGVIPGTSDLGNCSGRSPPPPFCS
jgi:hypothetical protein